MKTGSKTTVAFVGSLVSIALVLLISLQPIGARAATFDIPDGDVAGLSAAINAANAKPGADIINLAPGGTYTLTVPIQVINIFGGVDFAGLPQIYQPDHHQWLRGNYPKKQSFRYTRLPDRYGLIC
jgi:hypothetical protein